MDDERERLERDWWATFRAPMPYGFDVTDDDFPVLRECIEQRSQAPLDRVLRERHKDGNVY